MSRKVGMLLGCDRCHKEVFLECTGEGERDGGFTRWNIFEDPPIGWKSNTPFEVGTLCPECSAKYDAVITNFMKVVKAHDA